MQEIKSTVRNFIEKRINTDSFSDDCNIFQLGFVNSLFAMQLVNFIEESFSMVVNDEDLNVNNFSSITNITALVMKYKGVL